MTTESKGGTKPDQTGQAITFNYIKSHVFRTIHVDGAIGSLTPRGLIHAAIYSERMPIPKSAVHVVEENNFLSQPIDINVRPGVVREIEVSLLLDRNAAASLRDWLTAQISEYDKLKDEALKTEQDTK